MVRKTAQRILGDGGFDGGDDSVGLGSAAWAYDGDLKGLGMVTDLYGYQRVRIGSCISTDCCNVLRADFPPTLRIWNRGPLRRCYCKSRTRRGSATSSL